MPNAAYNTTLEMTGTSTAMTGEAMGGTGAGPYQITNSAKRVINPLVALTFYDNGIDCTADVLTVDYLFGKVTFTGSKTGPITVTGEYLPRLTFAEGKSVSTALTADELDTAVFGSQWRKRAQGLKGLDVEIESLALLTYDMDSGSGSRTIADVFTNATSVVLSVVPGGTGDIWRAFVTLFETDQSTAIDALVNMKCSFKSTVIRAANGDYVSPSFST